MHVWWHISRAVDVFQPEPHSTIHSADTLSRKNKQMQVSCGRKIKQFTWLSESECWHLQLRFTLLCTYPCSLSERDRLLLIISKGIVVSFWNVEQYWEHTYVYIVYCYMYMNISVIIVFFFAFDLLFICKSLRMSVIIAVIENVNINSYRKKKPMICGMFKSHTNLFLTQCAIFHSDFAIFLRTEVIE